MSRTDAVENILRLLRADPAFSAWAKGHPSLDAAWEACREPAWMLWLLQSLEYDERGVLRRLAVACARRVPFVADSACEQALDTASRVADCQLPEQALSQAYRAIREHAISLAGRADFGQSMAASVAACAAAVRARPMDAAMEASREALRAVTWDPGGARSAREEASWQASELRRLAAESIGPALDRARARSRGKLALI